ncbi:MAG: hypothetical protein FWD31_08535 [Planctomycetaceae bacterium]|nr:hypothetical protein [Planctomycetaceae bacterium]
MTLRKKESLTQNIPSQQNLIDLICPVGRSLLCHRIPLLTGESAYQQTTQAINPYGDCKACERIVETMNRAFNQ